MVILMVPEGFLSGMGLYSASMSSEGMQKCIFKGNEKIGLLRDIVETAALTPASEIGLWNSSLPHSPPPN